MEMLFVAIVILSLFMLLFFIPMLKEHLGRQRLWRQLNKEDEALTHQQKIARQKAIESVSDGKNVVEMKTWERKVPRMPPGPYKRVRGKEQDGEE